MSAGRFLSGGRYKDEPLLAVPFASLTTDPAFDPAANLGRMVQCDDGNRYHAAVIDGTPVWLLNKTGGVVDPEGVTFIEELFLQEFPEGERPSAAGNRRRFIMNGDTDRPELSDGTAWRSLVDEARAAEIAEDVVADVFRPIGETVVIELVNTGTEVDGVRYVGAGALGRALEYCSAYLPSYTAGVASQPTFKLVMKSGFIIKDQIFTSAALGNVILLAEDTVTNADRAFITKARAPNSQVHDLFTFGGGGSSPNFQCLIQPSGSLPPPDPESSLAPYTPLICGFRLVVGSRGSISFQARGLDDVLLPTPKIAGFDGFHTNVSSSGDLLIFRGVLRNATSVNLEITGGEVVAFTLDAVGAGTYGALVQGGTLILHTDGQGDGTILAGVYGQRFRKTALSDSPDDIRLTTGGRVVNLASLLLGGSNIPPNQFNGGGTFFDVRFTTAQPVRNPTFTVATAPSAAATPGATIYVSNGAAGAPVLAFSNGTNWLRCDTLAAISA